MSMEEFQEIITLRTKRELIPSTPRLYAGEVVKAPRESLKP